MNDNIIAFANADSQVRATATWQSSTYRCSIPPEMSTKRSSPRRNMHTGTSSPSPVQNTAMKVRNVKSIVLLTNTTHNPLGTLDIIRIVSVEIATARRSMRERDYGRRQTKESKRESRH
jgi:hypothetical protein